MNLAQTVLPAPLSPLQKQTYCLTVLLHIHTFRRKENTKLVQMLDHSVFGTSLKRMT